VTYFADMPFARMSLPLLLLGLTIAGYWYRVLRMARKARQRSGHSANVLPPEKVGRMLRIVWFPVVFVWIAHPFYSAFIAKPVAPTRLLWSSPVAAWAGAIVAGGCLAATRMCWRRMGTAWRMGIDPAETNPLITTGPFAYVRHPIYTLSAMMMLSTLAAIMSPLMLIVAAVHIGLLSWEARREERHLDRIHGDRYQAYRACVGRLVPRSVRPYTSNAPTK
jgi:protein-S-isoprenylcysteine O-methyltransferase Ste14